MAIRLFEHSQSVPGKTYARFRFISNGVASYNGYAPDGEVEDYHGVEIEPRPVVCTIGEAKRLPRLTYVVLCDKIVSAALSQHVTYVQESDGSAGIRVRSFPGVLSYLVGDVVCCYGWTGLDPQQCEMELTLRRSWLAS